MRRCQGRRAQTGGDFETLHLRVHVRVREPLNRVEIGGGAAPTSSSAPAASAMSYIEPYLGRN